MQGEKQGLHADAPAGAAYGPLYISRKSALPDASPIEAKFKQLMLI